MTQTTNPPGTKPLTLQAAVEEVLGRPFDDWMGNAGHGSDVLYGWLRTALADAEGPDDLRAALDAVISMPIDPYMGLAGHAHGLISHRLHDAINTHAASTEEIAS